MSGCQSCNSCNYGNTCSKCNSCESCNVNCNGASCNTIQAFCSTSGQSAGGFSFNQPIGKDELFLTKTNWNRLITYIREAYNKGSNSLTNNAQSGNGVSSPGKGGDSGLPVSDTNIFMTADMFNKVSSALGGLGSSGPSRRVQTDVDIVYGSYFKDLETYANNLNYKKTQCNNCNAGCNVKCNTCLVCNVENCGACNGTCQTHSSNNCCSSTCQHSCQSSCEKSAQTPTKPKK